jgi:hypothetical protein
MPKRSGPSDVNQAAYATVAAATADQGKDPAAVALGRRGWLVGGPARRAALTPEQRTESAKKAAASRWAGRKQQEPS